MLIVVVVVYSHKYELLALQRSVFCNNFYEGKKVLLYTKLQRTCSRNAALLLLRMRQFLVAKFCYIVWSTIYPFSTCYVLLERALAYVLRKLQNLKSEHRNYFQGSVLVISFRCTQVRHVVLLYAAAFWSAFRRA